MSDHVRHAANKTANGTWKGATVACIKCMGSMLVWGRG